MVSLTACCERSGGPNRSGRGERSFARPSAERQPEVRSQIEKFAIQNIPLWGLNAVWFSERVQAPGFPRSWAGHGNNGFRALAVSVPAQTAAVRQLNSIREITLAVGPELV